MLSRDPRIPIILFPFGKDGIGKWGNWGNRGKTIR
jgi:hypothetical protein